MSADIYEEETREDKHGNERLYSIIGTVVITYEVETPDGTRFVIEGTHQDNFAAQRFIDDHNREFCRNQPDEDESESEDEDEDEDEAD